MAKTSTPARAQEVLTWLEGEGSQRNRDGMARYGIVAPKVFGVSVGALQQYAKRFGRDHELAAALWQTGWYEARMLTAFVDDPTLVTPQQMDRWAKDFDNWAICDTLCMHLFDRTPHAWRKVDVWSRRRAEFVKRAAFALIASLALHDKRSSDDAFLHALRLVERESTDERHYVKKALNWALRSVGNRNAALHEAALDLSARLVASPDTTPRWIGKDALAKLRSPATKKRIAAAARPRSK